MVVSASRRTDIPAWYAPWMVNRLRAGYVLVRHPFRAGELWRVALDPAAAECIVFWTKNPEPLLAYLGEIDRMGFHYYFQFTLTPYGPEVEPGVPELSRRLRLFRELGERLGPERVVWRYDPIILNGAYPPAYHLERFGRLCGALRGWTRRCVVSFVDVYAKFPRAVKAFLGPPPPEEWIAATARGIGELARGSGMEIAACSEEYDLAPFGIARGACIDAETVGRVCTGPVQARKDPGQRPACGCIESVDIGAYDSCRTGCLYCYATGRGARRMEHDPSSPVLLGAPTGSETVRERRMRPLALGQTSFF